MTPDAKPAAAKTETKNPAKKAPAKGVNKSAEIRKIANGMKAKGEKPRPKTIIEILKKQGIAVSSPQVSMVLKSMGFKPRKRVTSGTAATNKAGKITIEDLIAARKVVAQFGGADRALAVIEALKSFEE